MTEWFKELADRFYSNFIKDDRWQYITNGLWVTIQITVLAVLVGIVIGIAAAWFLVLPAQVQNAKQGIDAELKAVNEEMDVKTATIAELEQNIKTLTSEKEKLENIVRGRR